MGPPGGSGGLSSLSCVQQKLEEDRARRSARLQQHTPGTIGRSTPEAAAEQPAVDLRRLSVEVAVQHPDNLVGSQHGLVPSADIGGGTTRAARGPVFGLDYTSDGSNFVHILRFLRDRKEWQAPDQPEARAALRQEAIYFGCGALVDHLDALEQDAM
eukprot:gnl/TRDRNA2_/TRDRNA2_60042_c0_seq1.p1 gnl/TRDRNA2_/TRDRNA2_60042_c0~~gnl/TRDRNA2_/TRDRNA2_60042_c0_seq1.p1  ORF type:complete len:178 (+),score=31.51 gnl/TRDRNA2_/TRDRNA2_60042_c0_seq1:66-536(+)